MIKQMMAAVLILTAALQAEEIYATFNVEAKKSANLAFITTGIVDRVNVDVGSVVKKDEVLAVLDNKENRAMLDKARTTYKFAKKDLARQMKVKNLIDAGKFDVAANKFESAKDTLTYQQALYAKTFLRAPFNGIIYEKALEVGDAVSGAALRTVLKIQSESARKIVLRFDQKYHAVVKVGQTFRYKVDGGSKVYSGTISKVYPYSNIADRKISAEVKAKDLMVGLFGDGYILASDANTTGK